MQTISSVKSPVYVVRHTRFGKTFGDIITADDEYVVSTQCGLQVDAMLTQSLYKFRVTGHVNASKVEVNL